MTVSHVPRDCFQVIPEFLEIHVACERPDHLNRIEDIAKGKVGSLKGKHGLACRVLPDRLFQ